MCYIKIFILMMMLLIYPGNESMTGITGKNLNIISCHEEAGFSCIPEDFSGDTAGKIEIKSGGIPIKDTLTVDYSEFRDDWNWFIGINLYPK